MSDLRIVLCIRCDLLMPVAWDINIITYNDVPRDKPVLHYAWNNILKYLAPYILKLTSE